MALKTPQTELEAVNIILSAVGEDQANALGSDLTGKAEAVLDEVSREIQEKGWHFNSEDNYPMSIASDGSVTLPVNVAQFDVDDSDQIDVVMRGNRLYDRIAHSYTAFGSGTLLGSVIWILGWDELPPVAKRFITMLAAHRYQKRYFSSETLSGFTEDDLRETKTLFISQEALQADYTIFDNYSVFRTLDRKSGSEFVV